MNQQLRQEYLKVRRELEMLKRSGRQKMKSPVPQAQAVHAGTGSGGRLGLKRHTTQHLPQNADSNEPTQDRMGGKAALGGEDERQEKASELEDSRRGIAERREHERRAMQPADEPEGDEPWQDQVEDKIEKLNVKLSDYYQRANAEDTDARPAGDQGGSEGFRGSFSRSTSSNQLLAGAAPEQPDKNKQYQYRNSMTSSQYSGAQKSATLGSPLRSSSRPAPKGLGQQQQQVKAKRSNGQAHGLYSAAGARPSSQSRRHANRKGSAGAGTAGGMSKSLKSTQNHTSKAGKSTHSYKEVEVIELNDSQEVPSATTSARALGGQASGRPAFSQASQSGAPTKRLQVPKKGKTKGIATHQTSGATKSGRDAPKAVKSGQLRDRRLAEEGAEFRGSFQNKGHRLWAPTAAEETPGGPQPKQKAGKKHPLKVKSFNSDRSIGSDGGDRYDRRGPEYSASASNNSEDNRSGGADQGTNAEEISSDEQEQSMIGTQYSQIVNIRTKHRHGAGKAQKAKSSQRARKKRKYSEDRVNEKHDRRWPVATIDLESGRRTGRGVTPEYVRRQRKTARDTSQPAPTSDQAQVILECQRQIQELQTQLQNLTHFPTGDTSQGSMLMMNPRVSALPHTSMNSGAAALDSHRLMQGQQMNSAVPMSTSPLQFAPTTMHMGLPTNNLMGQPTLPYPNQNVHQLHPGQQLQMRPSHAAEFEQYELRIRQLQAQLREQQLQLQLQEQQHEQVMRTQRTMVAQPTADIADLIVARTTSSPARGGPPAGSLHALQSPADGLQVRIGQPGSQMGVFTTPLTPVAPGQPPVAGSGSQIGPAPDSSVTQNHSNFFSQIKEIAKNIEERGHHPGVGSLGSSTSLDDAAGQGRSRGRGSPGDQHDELHDDAESAAVEVHHVTDLETTELDARRIGHSDRPEGFDGFETSVLDNQPRDTGPPLPEKGSFAPLPEYIESTSKYDTNRGESAFKPDWDEAGRRRGPGVDLAVHTADTRKLELSPDFAEPKGATGIQWLHGRADSSLKDNIQYDAKSAEVEAPNEEEESQEGLGKADQLLVIGFDEKPKGVNPLVRLRSPGRAANFTERNRLQPRSNFSISKAGTHIGSKGVAPRVALEITQSSGFSNPPIGTPKGQKAGSQGGPTLAAAAEERARKKREDAALLNQNAMPNLQEYARLRSGRGPKRGGNCSSPQPRRSSAFRRGQASQAAALANDPFQHRGDKSQPPKPREHKTKEELARIRREMMRSKFRDRDGPLQTKTSGRDTALETSSGFLLTTSGHHMDTEPNSTMTRGPKAEPRTELLTRLASGTKAKVDLQAMRRLTKGNYEKLPEILKKKEDAKRREELAVKKARAAAYQKELDARLRSGMKKRREKEDKEGEVQKKR